MSILIKGGYDAIRKQVVNVSLKRTNSWVQGMILGKHNKFICALNPRNDHTFEFVKYNNVHALLMNNTIVYEDPKFFWYKIDLKLDTELTDIRDPKFYSFINYTTLTYPDIKSYNNFRTLN